MSENANCRNCAQSVKCSIDLIRCPYLGEIHCSVWKTASICRHYDEQQELSAFEKAWANWQTECIHRTYYSMPDDFRAGWNAGYKQGKEDAEEIAQIYGCRELGRAIRKLNE